MKLYRPTLNLLLSIANIAPNMVTGIFLKSVFYL